MPDIARFIAAIESLTERTPQSDELPLSPGQASSELTGYLVIFVALVAFLLAAYIQGGGTWRGPHNLRKSIHPKGGAIGLQDAHPPSSVAHERYRSTRTAEAANSRTHEWAS
jgi:hypothetical protein